MSRHHEPFVVEEISFFVALIPIAWLLALTIGGRLFDRLRKFRARIDRATLLPTPD
ncbi:MAG TPA: hypothetical protein VGR69_08990 [Candidatus Rubrimentiphilum sp.]|nr:hypothetical protein [Candidatus Rubrimentiphilum sp.]